MGVQDGRHVVLAARAYTVPSTVPEEYPRLGTSLLFHPTLPLVLAASHAPTVPTLPPHIGAWCYAHATLPPSASPVTPALATLMTAACEDPLTAATAHLYQPPALFPSAAGAGGGGGAVLWCGGRAIPVCNLVEAAGAFGVQEDDEAFGPRGRALVGEGGEENNVYTAGFLWPTAPPGGSYCAALPCGAAGVVAGGCVGEAVCAPRAWFVQGGEGEGGDCSRVGVGKRRRGDVGEGEGKGKGERSDSEEEEGSSSSSARAASRGTRKAGALDAVLGGGLSLAEFAAALVDGGLSGQEGAAAAAAGGGPGARLAVRQGQGGRA